MKYHLNKIKHLHRGKSQAAPAYCKGCLCVVTRTGIMTFCFIMTIPRYRNNRHLLKPGRFLTILVASIFRLSSLLVIPFITIMSHAGLYNPATSVPPCFLDITFIVFHSMSLQSRSWILLRDKCHRYKKMVQCQSHYHSSTHLLEQFSLLTFFSLDKGTTEPAFSNLETFCSIFM